LARIGAPVAKWPSDNEHRAPLPGPLAADGRYARPGPEGREAETVPGRRATP
jgi:hypothetical protein